MASSLRSRVIRLAHQHPELRPDLLPLLKKSSLSTSGLAAVLSPMAPYVTSVDKLAANLVETFDGIAENMHEVDVIGVLWSDIASARIESTFEYQYPTKANFTWKYEYPLGPAMDDIFHGILRPGSTNYKAARGVFVSLLKGDTRILHLASEKAVAALTGEINSPKFFDTWTGERIAASWHDEDIEADSLDEYGEYVYSTGLNGAMTKALDVKGTCQLAGMSFFYKGTASLKLKANTRTWSIEKARGRYY